MENEEIRNYIIQFVEDTLNSCEAFTNVYGKDFVKNRLKLNLDKVIIDVSTDNSNTGFYDMDSSNIILFLNGISGQTITIEDIKNNKKLQHSILHESIHAIFKRTKEECEHYGIESGTGILEFYKNGTELGRGLNEGLTEWICQKAGYGNSAYMSEKNIVRMIELAIGEESVMKLANGHIKGNIANLLQMTEQECVRNLIHIDNINRIEMNPNLEDYEAKLDKSITDFETIIFEKYFREEIENLQNSQELSAEDVSRLFDLFFSIKGGVTIDDSSSFPLKFKNEIYPQLLRRNQKKKTQEISSLPVVYKKSLFQKIKAYIRGKFKKNIKPYETISTEKKIDNRKEFRKQISDISNYPEKSIRIEKSYFKRKEKKKKEKDR